MKRYLSPLRTQTITELDKQVLQGHPLSLSLTSSLKLASNWLGDPRNATIVANVNYHCPCPAWLEILRQDNTTPSMRAKFLFWCALAAAEAWASGDPWISAPSKGCFDIAWELHAETHSSKGDLHTRIAAISELAQGACKNNRYRWAVPTSQHLRL